MSQYYNSQRKKGLYDPNSKEPFKVSRSKIDLFLSCPKCFYLDRRLGVARPPGFPFSLNSAVDTLLKQEFDIHRADSTKHPFMEKYNIDAIPMPHKDLDMWRNNFKGVRYLHESTNLLIFGAIDDVWQDPKGNLIIVDYKATAKSKEITELDEEWHDGYKRQMEIYQWLFKKNNYKVSDTGYFVYCNGKADAKAFDKKLEFDISLIPYKGNSDWIDDTILDLKKRLDSDEIPESNPECDYCNYIKSVNEKI